MFRKYFLLWVGCFGLLGAGQASAESNPWRSSTRWFEVESFENGPSAERILSLCDDLRTELFRVWQGTDQSSEWEPRCKIRVHATRASYLQRVGSNGGQTSGCSLIQLDQGKIVCREIDLLLDQAGELPALPHELTHVVLADMFGGRQPPHWLDEGIAMLADTAAKQNLHHRDCHEALLSGRAMPIQQIVTLDEFSSADQMPAFYGQSLSLVRMLADRQSPAKLVDFAKDSINRGIEKSLIEHYAIKSVDELEKAWRAYVLKNPSDEVYASVVAIRFKP